jgi:signal transduction histidine kinase
MRWRIRSQLLIPLLILLLGVVGISTWTALASAQHARQRIETQMRDIARTFKQGPYFPRTPEILKLMHGLSEADFLLEKDSGEFTSNMNLQTLPDPLPEPLDDWESVRLGPRVEVGGQTYLCSGVRRESEVLYVLYPESLWHDALWAAVRPSLILGVFGGAASILLAVGVAHRLSRRVRELERRTRQIAAGDFRPMPLPAGADEIRDLAKSVNEMAQRLVQLQETVRQTERLRLLGQVSGGLAHQLRNGVTGARLAVQLHAGECGGKVDSEALHVALRQLTLVEANLKRFLDLGRTEVGKREPCSLIAVAEEAVALLQPQCRHAGIELTWQPPEQDGIVLGNSGQLGQLVLNVVGNAVEAAGPGGRVQVTLSVLRSSAVLEVRDSGPGPAPEVAERLFEPFVTGKRDGVGLGLAVARQAAEAHGGRITWRREEKQTCFVIEMPTTAARGLAGLGAKPRAAAQEIG